MALRFTPSDATMRCATISPALKMAALLLFLSAVTTSAQPAPSLPGYNCSDSIATKFSVPDADPCANTTAYTDLGSCSSFMAGNRTTPSPECCESARTVWSNFPGCFCKVTFFSKFPGDGPALALARAPLCNITDDLCGICPSHMVPYQSGSGGGAHAARKMNTASVVTISVIVTLAIVGFAWLVYWCKKKNLFKPKQSQKSKNYVPQFNNV